MTTEGATPRTENVSLEHAVAVLERIIGGNGGALAQIPGSLRDLRTALTAHCWSMESGDGGFEEIIREDPRLSHHVDELRIEHVATGQAIESLIDEVEHVPSLHHPAMLMSLTKRVRALIGSVERHHRHAADVMHEAFVAEIGAID